MTEGFSRGRVGKKPGARVLRTGRQPPWHVFVAPIAEKAGPRPSLWALAYGVAGILAMGTLSLMLPFSTSSGQSPSLIIALFTATSAVSLTGLVIVDTLTYWSPFGQSVIIGLIQLSGFGYMTLTTLLLIALGRRIGLRERILIGESVGLSTIGGAVALIRYMVVFTLVVEGIGAIVLSIKLSGDFSIGTAIWKGVFLSISAFNNAGFELFGDFRSLTLYQGDYVVLMTTAIMVILGGLSFLVVNDMLRTREPGHFSLNTKIVVLTSLLLLALGTFIILATEYADPKTLGSLPASEKIANAFFQSVTSRTAGFNSISIGDMSEYALFFTAFLMFIGAASGSAGGGIKVNTLGLIMVTIWSVIRGREHPGAFGREFLYAQISRALTVLVLALGVIGIIVFILTIVEDASFLDLLFETVSAFATVGLSTGITPDLTTAGKLLLIATMFIGRLGPLTLVLALAKAQKPSLYRHPQEIIRIG